MRLEKARGFLVFDIETLPDKQYKNALLGDICYVSVCDMSGAWGEPCQDLTQFFIDKILTARNDRKIIYAHNGFRFDYKRLSLKRLSEEGYNGKIIKDKAHNYKSIEVEKDGLKFWLQDTAVKFPSSLKKLLKTFAPHLPKGDLDLSKTIFDVSNPAHRQYAIRDSEGLYFAIEKIDRMMQDLFGISFHDRPTAPGLALHAFKTFCKANKIKYPSISKEQAALFRESYFGGQTLALDCNWHEDIIALDIHSSYGAAMLNNPMPYGSPIHFKCGPGHVLADDVLYKARVYVSRETFPSLKAYAKVDGKTKKGNIAGAISGMWWGRELRLARAFGAVIQALEEGWRWSETTDILQRFIAKIVGLREEKGSALDALGKLFQNSLYGRFSQGDIEEDTFFGYSRPDGGAIHYNPETDALEDYIYSLPHDSEKDRPAPIHWGSSITMLGRVNLNSAILCKPEAVHYCDTDSIFIDRADLPHFSHLLGDDYGQWGIESDKAGRFKAYGPKAYIVDGKRKNKGIPQNRFEEIRDKMKKDNPRWSDIDLNNYVSTMGVVSYVQFRGIHHVQHGASLGSMQDRKTAIPENVSCGRFDAAGRWHPDVASCNGDAGSLASEGG